ncbi:hypothetical protein ACIQNU_41525 [Streptomyces sp. NPDC091292]|uniref:hypothetical protein n=1 Tax=Streptomyces sp. NPDC091292 TaxID=3365991 RepID=UPI00382A78A3
MTCPAQIVVPKPLLAEILQHLPDADAAHLSWLTCDFDLHPHRDHYGYVDDIGATEQALWIVWTDETDEADEADEAEGTEDTPSSPPRVSVERICPSKSPSSEDACWLPLRHGTPHSWTRYE